MIFSSIFFIYYFLPILLLVYYLLPNKFKNFVLLFFSLLFYFLGEPKYVIILIISCVLNYMFGKLIYKTKRSKLILILAIIYNVGQLLYFKYTDFFISNLNNFFGLNMSLMHIVMPIGISFFTFQTLSYVIDVYNKKYKPSENFIDFMTYVSLFPQLIAGPIVRYSTIRNELKNRKHTFENFALGIKRFIIGLSKKVLLANVLGEICSKIVTETVLSSWVKPICYTLQIYFDFSGYSDMAIGLGLMFGFHFLENFNYPLIAKSVTDFWRRWHISLSSWFRDYVYIPLGGNRVNKLKFFRNILIVWFLTGFWHGANWNFILWGLYFGIILMIEKMFLSKLLDKTKIIKYIYTLFVVVISFMIFNSNSLNEIILNLKNMFFINNLSFVNKEIIYYLRNYFVFFIISIVFATPLLKNLLHKSKKINKVITYVEPFVYLGLLILSTAFLIDESFNPFLYFRF